MTVADIIITDPILLECLTLSHKTRQLCQEILQSLQTASAPPTPSSTATPAIAESTVSALDRSKQHKLLSAYLTQLRVLHRSAFLAARTHKQLTLESRQEVDRLHLQLQNLFYEQRFLRSEISACRDFPHKYTTLPLVPVEEFLARKPEYAEKDPHEVMIARLKDEMEERERLEARRRELMARKAELVRENKRRKDDLMSLDEQLRRFIESSRPIQATFQKEY